MRAVWGFSSLRLTLSGLAFLVRVGRLYVAIGYVLNAPQSAWRAKLTATRSKSGGWGGGVKRLSVCLQLKIMHGKITLCVGGAAAMRPLSDWWEVDGMGWVAAATDGWLASDERKSIDRGLCGPHHSATATAAATAATSTGGGTVVLYFTVFVAVCSVLELCNVCFLLFGGCKRGVGF